METANERIINDKRPSWDDYFLEMADTASKRATCDRGKSGCVIVLDKQVLVTGYVGSPTGFPHCDDVGHTIESGHCVATVHAEANAIIQAAKNGVRIDGAELYTTASPCWNCFKLIANAGITKVYYGEFYRDRRSLEIAGRLGMELVDLSET